MKKTQILLNLTIRTIFNYHYDKHINYKDLEILNINNTMLFHTLILLLNL